MDHRYRQRRTRRGRQSVAVMIVVVLGLAACGDGSDEPEPDNEGNEAEPAEEQPEAGGSIKVLVSAGHQQFNPVWDRLSDFEEETGIEVELDLVGTVDLEGALLRDIDVGGCTYDAVELLDAATAGAAPQMADLGPFLEASGSSTDELLDRHVDWQRDVMTFDGELKYHPFYSGAKGVAYRVDLLEDPDNQADFEDEYGYPFPLPPETPDQLRDLAEFFTTDDMYGIVFTGQGDSAMGHLEDLIWRSGVGGYQDEEGDILWSDKYPENQERVAAAAEWTLDLVDQGFAPSEVTAMATGEATSYYTDGNAAIIYDHVYLPWAEFNEPGVIDLIGESGSFEPPSFEEESGGIAFFWGYGIPECADNQEAAWQFIEWVMERENLELSLTEGVGVYVPTDLDLLDWAVNEGALPGGVADSVRNASPYRITEVTGQLRQGTHLSIVERLMQGEFTPEEYASYSGEQLQQVVDDAGLGSGGGG